MYSRTANGDVPPLRIIQGKKTQLKSVRSLSVDTIRNLLVAGTQARGPNDEQYGVLLTYDRKAEGDAAPLRVIEGDKTEIIRITQTAIYEPKGWILAAQAGTHEELHPDDGVLGVWHVNDAGNVAPRWKLRGPKSTLIKPRGIALIPKHKEIVVSDMAQNAVMSFYFPEVF